MYKDCLKHIFSVKNNATRKIVTILGIKFKFKSKKLIEKKMWIDISNDMLKNLRIDIVDMLSTLRTQEETFKKYKNCNINKEIVLVAPGPTLNYYSARNNAKYIGLNRAVLRDDIKYDYFFMQDYIAVKDYIKELEKERFKNTKKFFGVMKDYTYEGKASIPESISNRIGAERYCIFHQWGYFNNIFPRDIAFAPLATASSVAGSAIQFALYTNPKKIYLVGCDFSSDYFNENLKQYKLNQALLDSWIDIKHFANIWYPDTEIISINPVGLKGLFKDIYTNNFLEEHPEIKNKM